MCCYCCSCLLIEAVNSCLMTKMMKMKTKSLMNKTKAIECVVVDDVDDVVVTKTVAVQVAKAEDSAGLRDRCCHRLNYLSS